jgi:anti-sigma B factor antagonist
MSDPVVKHLRIKDVDGVTVVDFIDSGVMFEASAVETLGDELVSILLEQGRTKILLDFRAVQYVSSSMLGQLARLAREVRQAKGQLRIFGLGPILKDTFRISHFEQLFAIYDDEASALKSFH